MRSMIFVVAGLAACATSSNEQPQVEETGAALSVDYFGDTDVVGFRFTVTEVACPGETVGDFGSKSFDVDLVDGIFPGNVALEGMQFDNDSRHLGADLFVSLPEGCYSVLAQPVSAINDDGTVTASADCSAANLDFVEVEDGLTSEPAPLISQCVGDPIGALDVLVLLNHPPTIKIEIDEKFNYECETVEVCAKVEDVDDDPIEVIFKTNKALFTGLHSNGGYEITTTPTVVGFENGHRIWKACADITTQYTGEYTITAKAFDLSVVVENGKAVRIEDLPDFPEGERSFDELSFPIYTNWVEDTQCYTDDNNNGEKDDGELDYVDGSEDSFASRDYNVKYEGCTITPAQEFYCEFNCDTTTGNVEGPDCAVQYEVCTDGILDETKLYPWCPTS